VSVVYYRIRTRSGRGTRKETAVQNRILPVSLHRAHSESHPVDRTAALTSLRLPLAVVVVASTEDATSIDWRDDTGRGQALVYSMGATRARTGSAVDPTSVTCRTMDVRVWWMDGGSGSEGMPQRGERHTTNGRPRRCTQSSWRNNSTRSWREANAGRPSQQHHGVVTPKITIRTERANGWILSTRTVSRDNEERDRESSEGIRIIDRTSIL